MGTEDVAAKRRRQAETGIARPPLRNAADNAWEAWGKRWVSWDPNDATRRQISDLLEAGHICSLRELLGSRLEFGTAGLRGPMGAGSARMNDLVVLQSTQGVCSYLERVFGDAGKQRGVIIGYDHRARNGCDSKTLARRAASVFLHRGFKVYLYNVIVATPLVPWGLEQKKCCAGVMLTASHNPADDNGYKLYWENGAQIIPPHDGAIAELIEENLEPWTAYGEKTLPGFGECTDKNCVSVSETLIGAYFQKLATMSRFRGDNAELELRITYTPMHGVGHPFVVKAFEAFGHPTRSLLGVAKQLDPDPDFPTVAFPNPEEGKGALELAFATAEAGGSSLVLANDPDADRLSVAERNELGEWHIFTGNEIGALLGHWCWRVWRKENPEADPSKVYMIASTVSSKFLQFVAQKEGFNFCETLTGFKWMGSKAAELRASGFEVLFSFEEAIGFCVGDAVNDKDGILAAATFAEMAKQLQKENKTCRGHLADLYDTYGHVLSLNSYAKSYDPALTRRIFERQRSGSASSGVGRYLLVDGFTMTGVRDLTIGYDTRTESGNPELPLNLGGEMITYYFGNDEAQVTLRSSGTEPKIKWYSEMRCRKENWQGAEDRLKALVQKVVLRHLDPDGNGLEVRLEDRDLLGGA